MRSLSEEDIFYHFLRASPLTLENRELLQVAEKWLSNRLTFPPISSLKEVFKEIDENQWYLITILGGLVSNINTLNFILRLNHKEPRDQKILKNAIQLHAFEMQRIFSSLFTLNHTFWQKYYKRLSDALGFQLDDCSSRINQYYIYLLPIDALYELDKKQKNLEYELICQSLQTILKARYKDSSMDRISISDYQIALQLTRNIKLPKYDTWVRDLMTKTP